MSDENNLMSPEREAELERKIADFNRQMSFSVVNRAEKPSAQHQTKDTAVVTVEQPKPLGW